MITRREALTLGAVALAQSTIRTPVAASTSDCSRDGRVQLADGRWLSYREYGQTEGSLVFYFHGTPGSRLELSLAEEESCFSGARVIAVDRPGIGRSSYQSCRKITDWPTDVEELATLLGYGEQPFGVLGLSGGAPYAAACAAMIPDRLTHVALVSGYAPYGAPGTCPGNQDKTIALVARRQRLAKTAFRMIDRRLARKPDKVIQTISKSWTAADRKLIFCNPTLYRKLIANLSEATHCGPEGLVADVRLLACPCWGFCLSDIQGVSLSIWQGGCDRIVHPSKARYFHSQIEGSELTIDPQAGHITMFKTHAAEILSQFLS